MSTPRIAIAHDYITQRGGAERVVLALTRMFPDAVLYTTLYNAETTYPEFRDVTIVTSPLNRIRFLRTHHRAALPLLAWASSRVRVDADVLVASSSGWAHGFRNTGQKLVYCHSPARWLYRSDEYLGADAHRSLIGWILAALTPALLRWDKRAAAGADRYLANSTVIAERIKNAYGFDAEVVFPPFGVSPDGLLEPLPDIEEWVADGYYLVVSRLMPYKNVDQAIEAVRERDHKLLIVGAGPLDAQLQAQAPDNVRIVSNVGDRQLRWAYRHARAVIAPSFEDFGLTPLEAGVFGKPVAALRAGGYLDSVVGGRSGVFFDEARAADIARALDEIEAHDWDADEIIDHAASFGEAHFHAKIAAVIQEMTEEDERRHA